MSFLVRYFDEDFASAKAALSLDGDSPFDGEDPIRVMFSDQFAVAKPTSVVENQMLMKQQELRTRRANGNSRTGVGIADDDDDFM